MEAVRRILDADYNRAREAARVIEDFARFVLNAAGPAERGKNIRHDLRAAYERLGGDAANLSARDTPGDVGTTIKTADESRRADPAAVLAANFKRLSEALRSLEEFGKTVSPAAAAECERLRYATYSLEHEIGAWLRPSRKFDAVRLYVIVTEALCSGPVEKTVEAAVDGGADCIQLREKTMPDGRLLELAVRVREITARRGALFIMNDRPDLAVLSHADGVHVGQTELPCRWARAIVGADRIVGVSTHNIEHARAAVADGADYIGVGPMFRSATKPRDFVAGVDYLKQVVAEIPIPHAAIAGITLDNIDQLSSAGCRCVAVCSAIIAEPDVRAAAETFKRKMQGSGIREGVGCPDDQQSPKPPGEATPSLTPDP
jgi:thiamine-phosphate pyrophosphorylase